MEATANLISNAVAQIPEERAMKRMIHQTRTQITKYSSGIPQPDAFSQLLVALVDPFFAESALL